MLKIMIGVLMVTLVTFKMLGTDLELSPFPKRKKNFTLEIR